MNCNNCGEPTKNPRFCSRSCSAKTTNAETKKRKKVVKIKSCTSCNSVFVTTSRTKRCEVCVNSPYADKTLEQVEIMTGGSASRFAAVRQHAQRVASGRLQHCAICEYSTHVEVCHIKPIHKFDRTSLLKVVNADTNIVLLCRNHHWELDNGVLKLI